MSNVLDQLRTYQAMKPKQGENIQADAQIITRAVAPPDFFKNLMLRWQNNRQLLSQDKKHRNS